MKTVIDCLSAPDNFLLRCIGDKQFTVGAGHGRRQLRFIKEIPTERKTGVKHAEVITVQLVQDARGWLRLAS